MKTLTDCHTRNLLLDVGSPAEFRQKLLAYFETTYSLFERLFDCFASGDTFYIQPEPLRHPHLFYFGHTATFYINKLNVSGLSDVRVNPEFESIFAIGVDEMSWDDLNSANYDWPDVQAVRDYRVQVRGVVRDVIQRLPLTLPVGWTDPAWAILMGIEHERIHLETSSVLIRQTKLKYLADPASEAHAFWRRCNQTGPAPSNELLAVPGGWVKLGKTREHNQYGWDNEYGHHETDIAAFQASRYLVSNGEYLEFVEAGGYQQSQWWTREGQGWLDWRKAEHPVFWRRLPQGGWRYRALLEEVEMPWDWPVDVNWLEAKAFCNWKAARTGQSIRLPTEDEWVRLLDHTGIQDEPDWGEAGKAPGNINLEYWASSCPVNRFQFKDGFCDVVGNVWQWTETPIAGFDGFEVHPWYDDFSTPTFDDKHNLIKGGSWISTGNEASRHARYAFRRHFFQHAGFRYVAAGQSPYADRVEHSTENLYETDQQLSLYCEFHYGPEYLGVANFPKACAELCLEYMAGRPMNRALDLGCATGRGAYELARQFKRVHGIDFTARFIRLAIALQEQGELAWEIATEGELTESHGVNLHDLGLTRTAGRVEFWQGDAANLKPQFTGYDLIYCGNLIDRMVSPRHFLQHIHERLNPGGLLILTSPYTWLAEFTTKDEWLGGRRMKDGHSISTLDGLKATLGPHFRLLDTRDVPFVIRETRRKYQHTLAEMSVWERL